MNRFRKFCPNVWIAECDQEHKKGEVIEIETKYGKDVPCMVYNLIKTANGVYWYSIVKVEDQTYAERKAERYHNSTVNHMKKSNAYYEASNEGREFLSLGEPIKIGHHSEKRHRALIERNNRRMDKCVEFAGKAGAAESKAEYWEAKANEITLAMPGSLEYFRDKLEQAIDLHKGLKNGTVAREHAYSLAYAANAVKDLKKKVEIALLLWS